MADPRIRQIAMLPDTGTFMRMKAVRSVTANWMLAPRDTHACNRIGIREVVVILASVPFSQFSFCHGLQ